MAGSTIFNIKVDFKKSIGSYIFDQNTKKKYLDFFGQYSTLTVGYNSTIFNKSFDKKIRLVSKQKTSNCEIISKDYLDFDKLFKKKLLNKKFSYTHYCCTGALAVESAIKSAIEYHGGKRTNVLAFKGNFHGINSYGGIFTDRFYPVNKRLKHFPGNYFPRLRGLYIHDKQEKKINKFKIDLINYIKKYKPCAILIEPIQCTNGDQYFNREFFLIIKKICKKFNVVIIFDEIQTGFYTSGAKWYFQLIKVEPDILVFGKKSQVSGIAIKKKFAHISKNPNKLEVTYDSDIIDMIRCSFIIKYLEKNNFLNKINLQSDKIKKFLLNFTNIQNVRVTGYLIAFDFNSSQKRDEFIKNLKKNGMLANPTKNKTVRFRPNLILKERELNEAFKIIKKTLKNL